MFSHECGGKVRPGPPERPALNHCPIPPEGWSPLAEQEDPLRQYSPDTVPHSQPQFLLGEFILTSYLHTPSLKQLVHFIH